MKKLLLAFALLLPGSAWAADLPLPTKAPAVAAPIYPYSTAGIYGGITTFMSDQTVNVGSPIPGTSGSLSATGGSVGIVGGYSMPINHGAEFAALQFSGAWQNLDGSASAGLLNFKGPFRGEVLAKVGMPWSQITTYFPTLTNLFGSLPTLPLIPAGLTTTTAHAYVGGGVAFEDISASVMQQTGTEWSISGVARLGTLWQLTSGAAVDTWIEYEGTGKSLSVSGSPMFTPTVQGQNSKWLAGVDFLL
jgi:hypothetical protein